MSPGLIIFGTGAHARKAYHCATLRFGAIVDHDAELAAFSHLRPGQVCPAAGRWPV